MKNKKGEIGTIVMMALLIIVSLISFGSSNFLSKKQTVDTKAAITCKVDQTPVIKCGSGNNWECTTANGCDPSKCTTANLEFNCCVLNYGACSDGSDKYRWYGCTGQFCQNQTISQSNGPGHLVGCQSGVGPGKAESCQSQSSTPTPTVTSTPNSTDTCTPNGGYCVPSSGECSSDTCGGSYSCPVGGDYCCKACTPTVTPTRVPTVVPGQPTFTPAPTQPASGDLCKKIDPSYECKTNMQFRRDPKGCDAMFMLFSTSANSYCKSQGFDTCCNYQLQVKNMGSCQSFSCADPVYIFRAYYKNDDFYYSSLDDCKAKNTSVGNKDEQVIKTAACGNNLSPTPTITSTPTTAVTGECNNFTCSSNSSIKYSYKCANPNFGGCGGSWNFYTESNCSGNFSTFNSLESMTPIINSYCTSSLRPIHLNIILKATNPIPVEPTKPGATFTICFETITFDDVGSPQTTTVCPVNKIFNLTEIDADGYLINKILKGPHELSWTLTFNPEGWDWQDTLSGSLVESGGQITGEILIN